ncbi:MAG: transcriptional regulator [Hyphomicrobiales bacterium]|nr:MAG: transcriptional regulator [Hyphomicrobiales bacterium]
MDTKAALDSLSALAQPTRLEAFRLLVKAGAEGMPAGTLAETLGAMPNTLSTHLGILTRAGLAVASREGRVIRYTAQMDGMRDLLAYLMEDCCNGNPDICNPLIETITCSC